jgi:hypothetical protein
MERDPLWLPKDEPSIVGEVLAPVGITGNRSGKWSRAMADKVVEIVGECGSPGIAAKRLGINVHTIMYHRKKNPEFAAAYDEAMRLAVETLVTNSIARAGDMSDPSNEALTLAWLRPGRPGERLPGRRDGHPDRRHGARLPGRAAHDVGRSPSAPRPAQQIHGGLPCHRNRKVIPWPNWP